MRRSNLSTLFILTTLMACSAAPIDESTFPTEGWTRSTTPDPNSPSPQLHAGDNTVWVSAQLLDFSVLLTVEGEDPTVVGSITIDNCRSLYQHTGDYGQEWPECRCFEYPEGSGRWLGLVKPGELLRPGCDPWTKRSYDISAITHQTVWVAEYQPLRKTVRVQKENGVALLKRCGELYQHTGDYGQEWPECRCKRLDYGDGWSMVTDGAPGEEGHTCDRKLEIARDTSNVLRE